MGKVQFTKIVSAFEQSMAGSAQEKLRRRSDLEAMVEQIEQETLEEQGHALLHSWQEATKTPLLKLLKFTDLAKMYGS